MNATQLQARIAATNKLIIVYEDAALALGTGGVQSYILDTGQSRQSVTRLDLKDIQSTIDALYNRCVTLGARLNGANVTIARGAW